MKIVQIDPDNWEEGRGYRKNRLLSAEALRQPGALLQIVAIPAGAHVPPHSHRTSVEVYVVRRGVCELRVNGVFHEMRPGDVVLMEPGDVHELFNRGEEVFEVWVFKTNSGPRDTFWIEESGRTVLHATNSAYAAINDNHRAKQEMGEERAIWDRTLLDGLEDEEWSEQ